MRGSVCLRGRASLRFVGVCGVAHVYACWHPHAADRDAIDADVAMMGAPHDLGRRFRSGARFGPRSFREALTLLSFGHAGAQDHEDDVVYLPTGTTRIVDIGDADVVHADTVRSHANIEFGVRKILAAGAFPVVLEAIARSPFPASRAFDDRELIHVVQIDARLEFVDERHGVRFDHGNPMRRAAERDHVTGLSQIGIRNVSSTARDGSEAARGIGSDILSVRQVRRLGIEGTPVRLATGARHQVMIDIDGFDPSIAPSKGTQSHGVLPHYETTRVRNFWTGWRGAARSWAWISSGFRRIMIAAARRRRPRRSVCRT